MGPGKKIKPTDRMSYSVRITDLNVTTWTYTICTAFVTKHIPFWIFYTLQYNAFVPYVWRNVLLPLLE
jgi:hypothetical protein